MNQGITSRDVNQGPTSLDVNHGFTSRDVSQGCEHVQSCQPLPALHGGAGHKERTCCRQRHAFALPKVQLLCAKVYLFGCKRSTFLGAEVYLLVSQTVSQGNKKARGDLAFPFPMQKVMKRSTFSLQIMKRSTFSRKGNMLPFLKR